MLCLSLQGDLLPSITINAFQLMRKQANPVWSMQMLTKVGTQCELGLRKESGSGDRNNLVKLHSLQKPCPRPWRAPVPDPFPRQPMLLVCVYPFFLGCIQIHPCVFIHMYIQECGVHRYGGVLLLHKCYYLSLMFLLNNVLEIFPC